MRYIKPEELKIFQQARELKDEWRQAETDWLEQVKRSHKNEISYERTIPAFDHYITLFNNWKKFRDKNAAILFVKVIV